MGYMWITLILGEALLLVGLVYALFKVGRCQGYLKTLQSQGIHAASLKIKSLKLLNTVLQKLNTISLMSLTKGSWKQKTLWWIIQVILKESSFIPLKPTLKSHTLKR